jgi:hypothetical protein
MIMGLTVGFLYRFAAACIQNTRECRTNRKRSGEIKALIRLAEIETGLTRFCELIGGYLYLVNRVWESDFDFC